MSEKKYSDEEMLEMMEELRDILESDDFETELTEVPTEERFDKIRSELKEIRQKGRIVTEDEVIDTVDSIDGAFDGEHDGYDDLAECRRMLLELLAMYQNAQKSHDHQEQ